MENSLQLNEKVVRVNAFVTILIASVSLILKNEWLILFLAIDFFIRGYTKWPSPVSFVSKFIVKLLNLALISIYAPPKKFAAKVGFVFSIVIFLFTLVQWEFMSILVSIILISCAFLEAFLKICVGCYVYDWFIVPVFYEKINKKSLNK
jgi:hypothetical protein